MEDGKKTITGIDWEHWKNYAVELSHQLDHEIAQEMQKLIQEKALAHKRLSDGWSAVAHRDETSKRDIQEWCSENCVMEYMIFGDLVIFQSLTDAVLFQLTWT